MKTSHCLTIAAFGLAIITVSTATVQAEDYLYETNNGTITITGYIGSGGDVTIPDRIDGLPVTIIGAYAFYGCTGLTSITLPNSVTSIGERAFSGCSGLTSITIPNSVTGIGGWAFAGCTNLAAIDVDPQNPAYRCFEGVLFNKSQTILVQFPAGKAGDYVVPSGITSIGDGAFGDCASLTRVTIPDSVTNLGEGAFARCTSLTEVTIPNSVNGIGRYTFDECANLTSVTIPDSVTSIGEGAFSYCTGLKKVAIGNGVTSIGYAAFLVCSRLTSITIPGGVTSIGDIAFYWCTNLMAVYFHASAPSLGQDVFDWSPNVAVYYLPGTIGWGDTFGDRPTAPWLLPNPLILTTTPNFGIQTNQFGFRISWATNASVVVEASSLLVNPVWSPVSTNTLTDGWSDFSDAEWTNYPARFYRIRQW